MAIRLASRAVVILLLFGAVAAPAFAQQPPPQNLQVLPKDIPRPQLTAIMRSFTQALGVRCEYCHALRDGVTPAPGQQVQINMLDLPSDAKAAKRKARYMLRMTDSLNRVVLANLPDRRDPPVAVNCMTCHRMNPVPTTIEAVLAEVIEKSGVDSAVARYRLLRATEMLSGKYNFGEQPVSELARALGEQGKHSDAIRLLEMNQEFFPNSVGIDLQIAELHAAAGNREAAIARLRAVLAKNPSDARAQAALRRLGEQP
jgi:tetratricopeptide (TPR) repeat protein